MQSPKTDKQREKYEKILNDINDNDVVLIPFFPEPAEENEIEQTPMLVEL